jgi:hypothetical protein
LLRKKGNFISPHPQITHTWKMKLLLKSPSRKESGSNGRGTCKNHLHGSLNEVTTLPPYSLRHQREIISWHPEPGAHAICAFPTNSQVTANPSPITKSEIDGETARLYGIYTSGHLKAQNQSMAGLLFRAGWYDREVEGVNHYSYIYRESSWIATEEQLDNARASNYLQRFWLTI